MAFDTQVAALLKISEVCSAEGSELPEGLAQAIHDLAADNGSAESALERLPAILVVPDPSPALKAALDAALKALSAPQAAQVTQTVPAAPAASGTPENPA
jgi:hypothetical protein